MSSYLNLIAYIAAFIYLTVHCESSFRPLPNFSKILSFVKVMKRKMDIRRRQCHRGIWTLETCIMSASYVHSVFQTICLKYETAHVLTLWVIQTRYHHLTVIMLQTSNSCVKACIVFSFHCIFWMSLYVPPALLLLSENKHMPSLFDLFIHIEAKSRLFSDIVTTFLSYDNDREWSLHYETPSQKLYELFLTVPWRHYLRKCTSLFENKVSRSLCKHISSILRLYPNF